MKRKPLIIVGLIVAALVVGAGAFAWYMGFGVKIDPNNLPQFVQADFIDLSKIGSISKFRSGEGHDFSGGGETCRSMKHYFTPIARSQEPPKQGTGKEELPPAPTPDTAIAIYSPVDGRITSIGKEHTPIGEQISIAPNGARGYAIRLFHIYKDEGVHAGMAVKAGQKIGAISNLSGTDIAIEVGGFIKPSYVSYFEVMPDSLFATYQTRGATSRSDFIFTKEFRDTNPFKCNGEEFAENYSGAENGQDVTLNGWTPPVYQQNSGNQNTNTPMNYGNDIPANLNARQ